MIDIDIIRATFSGPEIIPPRGKLTCEQYRKLLSEEYDIHPGTERFMEFADQFQPVRVDIGHVLGSDLRAVWSPCKTINPFLLVSGGSGSGKTEAVKRVAAELIAHAVPVVVLDFHGDLDVPGVESVLLSSGMDSVMGVNPLIIPFSSRTDVGLYDHFVRICQILKRHANALGRNQIGLLHTAVETAFVQSGIEERKPETWSRPPPGLRQVINVLKSWRARNDGIIPRSSVEGCIAAVEAMFGHPVFNRERNLKPEDLIASAVRLDLSAVADQVKAVIAEAILYQVLETLKSKGPVRNFGEQAARMFVIVDEAKILSTARGDVNKSSAILNVLSTEARKFGLGMVLASQSESHFGEDVRSNMASTLKLGTDMRSRAGEGAALGGAWYQPKGIGILSSSGYGNPIEIQIEPITRPET